MSQYNFNSASSDEPLVFGAQRPGYPSKSIPDAEVHRWVEYMQQQGIQRVCCLLKKQLSHYDSDLLAAYRDSFGEEAVCSGPVEDYELATAVMLTDNILPFLAESVRRDERVVVHCSAGSGRTGHVLAAWLVYGRGMTNEAAIGAVTRMGRNPRESGDEAGLHALLDACRDAAAGDSR